MIGGGTRGERRKEPAEYRAGFYSRAASGTLEEHSVIEAAPSLAEFRRRAQQTARAHGWRLAWVGPEEQGDPMP